MYVNVDMFIVYRIKIWYDKELIVIFEVVNEVLGVSGDDMVKVFDRKFGGGKGII